MVAREKRPTPVNLIKKLRWIYIKAYIVAHISFLESVLMKGTATMGSLGLAISSIVVLNITVPIIKEAVAGSANLSATEVIIAGFISLFCVVGLLVAAGQTFGLI